MGNKAQAASKKKSLSPILLKRTDKLDVVHITFVGSLQGNTFSLHYK